MIELFLFLAMAMGVYTTPEANHRTVSEHRIHAIGPKVGLFE
jgi:hypothetical protein